MSGLVTRQLRFSSVSLAAACRIAFGMLLVAIAGVPAIGDQVWIEPQRPTSLQSEWYPRSIETLAGTVVQFDAEQLRLKPEDSEEEMIIAATRVLWITLDPITPTEAESLRLFAAGEYASSLVKLPEILRAKPAVWRQQWMTMTAAVAAWKSGRSDLALELVSQLDQRPLPPLVVAWLPIAWTNRPVAADAITAAQARLSDPSPLVRLVAVSWLLSSPQRAEAAAVLKQLEPQPRKEIARFARILSWRIATPPEVIDSHRNWEQAIDSLPMVAQTGPLTLLIDKLRAANQLDQANRLQWSLELTPIHPHYDWLGPTSSDRP